MWACVWYAWGVVAWGVVACDSPGYWFRSAVSLIGVPPRFRRCSRAVPSIVLLAEDALDHVSHEA